jgi:hypothetical protein
MQGPPSGGGGDAVGEVLTELLGQSAADDDEVDVQDV